MYILGDYRKLLMAIIYKFIVQLSLMLILIRSLNNAVPLAIIAGYLFVSLILFINVGRKITLPALKSFIFKLSAISIISMVLLLIHIYTIEFYIEFSNLQIFIWSVPLLVISLMFFVFFVRRNGLDNGLIDKIIGKLWKKSI
jgi:hypothetical protein